MEERIISFRTFKQSYCEDSKLSITKTKCLEKYHDKCNERDCLRWKKLRRKGKTPFDGKVKHLIEGITNLTGYKVEGVEGNCLPKDEMISALKRLL
jgi:hypothetical protein